MTLCFPYKVEIDLTKLTRGDGPALAEFSEHVVFQPVVATNGAATVNRAKV